MSVGVVILLAFLCLCVEGFFSGCETGLYCLSRARLEVEARHGGWGARVLLALVRRDSWVLIAMLIGTTLGLELATWLLDHQLASRGFGLGSRQLILALGLTPFAFYFGEALPKELYRRQPHRLMGACAPVILASLVLFAPLVLLLRGMTRVVERLSGVVGKRTARGLDRAHLLSVLDEGAGSGELGRRAVELAHNALTLRSTPLSRAMIPWASVSTLDASLEEQELRTLLETSHHTRLPLLEDGRIAGYVHQIDVLAQRPPGTVLEHRRDVLHLEPGLSVHRALARLRTAGGRLAIVGPPEAPLGIVTLKDLLEELSGDLGGW